MAFADRYTGKQVIVEFLPEGGTYGVDEVNLSGDHTSLTLDRRVDSIDMTAGTDTDRAYKATLKSLDWTMSAMATSDSFYTDVYPGAVGTLYVYPKGKGSGLPIYQFSTLITGLNFEYPFDGAVEVEITGQKNGAMVKDFGDTQA